MKSLTVKMPGSESNGFWRPWETGDNGSRCGLMHPPPEKWQEVKLYFHENMELRAMMMILIMTIVMLMRDIVIMMMMIMIMIMMTKIGTIIRMMIMMIVSGH